MPHCSGEVYSWSSAGYVFSIAFNLYLLYDYYNKLLKSILSCFGGNGHKSVDISPLTKTLQQKPRIFRNKTTNKTRIFRLIDTTQAILQNIFENKSVTQPLLYSHLKLRTFALYGLQLHYILYVRR